MSICLLTPNSKGIVTSSFFTTASLNISTFQSIVIQVVEAGLDVVGIGVDAAEKEFADGGFAVFEFFAESKDEGWSEAVFFFEGLPPLLSATRRTFPREMFSRFFNELPDRFISLHPLGKMALLVCDDAFAASPDFHGSLRSRVRSKEGGILLASFRTP